MAARSRIQSASSRLAQPRHGYPENGGAIRNYPQPRTGRSGEEEKSPAQAFEKLGAGDWNRISDLRFTNKLQGVAQVADDLGPTILFPKLSHNPPSLPCRSFLSSRNHLGDKSFLFVVTWRSLFTCPPWGVDMTNLITIAWQSFVGVCGLALVLTYLHHASRTAADWLARTPGLDVVVALL